MAATSTIKITDKAIAYIDRISRSSSISPLASAMLHTRSADTEAINTTENSKRGGTSIVRRCSSVRSNSASFPPT